MGRQRHNHTRPEPASAAHQRPAAADDSPDRYDVAQLHAPIMREKTEPHDGYEPVPLWLFWLFGLLLFWGGWYVSQYSGGWRSDVLDPHPEARFASAAALPEAPPDPVEWGSRLFRMNCESCHQSSGLGVSGQYPPLADSSWALGEPHRLTRILLNGLEGPLTVKDQTYNGNMPAFGDRLSDEKIAAVLTYVRQAWGNGAGPITPQVVAAARQATKDRQRPWTAVELLALVEPDEEETVRTDDQPREGTQPAQEAPVPAEPTEPSPADGPTAPRR